MVIFRFQCLSIAARQYNTFSIFYIFNGGRHKKPRQRIKNTHAHDSTHERPITAQLFFLFTFFIAHFLCILDYCSLQYTGKKTPTKARPHLLIDNIYSIHKREKARHSKYAILRCFHFLIFTAAKAASVARVFVSNVFSSAIFVASNV